MSITPSFVQILPPPLVGETVDLSDPVAGVIIGIAPGPLFADSNNLPLIAGIISGGSGSCPEQSWQLFPRR